MEIGLKKYLKLHIHLTKLLLKVLFFDVAATFGQASRLNSKARTKLPLFLQTIFSDLFYYIKIIPKGPISTIPA